MAEARHRWKANQTLLDTTRLVFVDETATSTKMVRTHGRCRRGQRLIGKAPWGHWKTTTFTAGLRCDGLVAPWVLDGPMNGEAFLVYVEKVLTHHRIRYSSMGQNNGGGLTVTIKYTKQSRFIHRR